MPVHNADIAAMIKAGELLEIKGDNPFRTRAYQRAARVIESLPKSAESMLQAGEEFQNCRGSARIWRARSGHCCNRQI